MLDQMTSASTRLPTPQGPGTVSGAPNLPAGFTDTFTSRYIDTGGLRQHAVIVVQDPDNSGSHTQHNQ